MASGVAANPDCLTKYQELKLGKKQKYIIFAINDAHTEIVVEKMTDDGDWDTFVTSLPPAEPRYVVYDFEYEAEAGGKRNKLVFIYWSPDDSKIKKKMVYASSKDSLRKALVGISAEVQANEADDLSISPNSDFLKKVIKGN